MENATFVGRAQELAELRTQLDAMLTGRSRVCFVTGQAGSGKSALVRHFIEEALAAVPDLVVAIGSCNAQTGIGDPYLPFREALGMLTGDGAAQQAAGKITAENASRLRTVMVRAVQVLVEVAPELVNVLVPGGKLLAHVGQAMVKRAGWMERLDQLTKREALMAAAPLAASEQARIFEQYTAFLQRLSADTPILLFLDDLQWADSASLNLLFHLGRTAGAHRILIVGAYRPTDVALGRNGGRHPLEPVVLELTRYFGDITIDLDEIPTQVSRQFVADLIDSEPNRLGPSFLAALYYQTGGHALFTVELLRALQERGDLVRDAEGYWVEGPSLDWSALPARVEGVIAERIARLDEELRGVLTIGSIEGEEFSAEVVARVEALGEREAIRLLSDELQRRHGLLDAKGLVRIGALRLSVYRFVHNLFYHYLYNQLDEAERAYLHRDVGNVLETLFAAQTETVAAGLARHFELAGLPDKATTYRLQAGNKARRMSAHQDAIGHLRQGLRLLQEMPAGPERVQLEIGLQTALGMALIATQGYAAQEVEQALGRGLELSRRLGDPGQIIPLLFGLSTFHLVRADLLFAYEEASELLAMAEQAGDGGYKLGAHLIIGVTAMYQGRLDVARSHLEQAAVQYEPEVHRELAYAQTQDPAVAAFSFLALVRWIQGYPEQGMAASKAARALATRIDHPYTLALAQGMAIVFYHLTRQDVACQDQANAVREAGQSRFPFWEALGTITQGWIDAHQGQVDGGSATMARGMAQWEGTGACIAVPYQCAWLAELNLLAGRRDEGLRLLDKAENYPAQAWWRTEQMRLRAELLLLAPGADAEAEIHLRQAVALAKSQGARSLELRAAMSLARLHRRQGRADEGRARLLACYSDFTEGLATPDLVEARALLAELGQGKMDQAVPDGQPLFERGDVLEPVYA